MFFLKDFSNFAKLTEKINAFSSWFAIIFLNSRNDNQQQPFCFSWYHHFSASFPAGHSTFPATRIDPGNEVDHFSVKISRAHYGTARVCF